MKLHRLMGITIYLLNHGKTSAHTLAKEFEVSTRTIMRDMEALEQAGIPIQSTYGTDGGYQILDTYIMDKQLADASDYSFIYAALKGLASAYTNKAIEQTLQKVSLLASSNSSIDLDFSIAHENQDTNAKIQILEKAISGQKVVQFQYTNNEGVRKDIQVEPVGVTYRWYNWYLIGYYEKYHDYCMFKLVRMEHPCITRKSITRQYSLQDALANLAPAQNLIQVKLKGKAKVKAKCKEYLNGEITKEYENGDFEYSLTVPENETFWYGVILSCGNDVKILEPQSVIERIVTTCKVIMKEYGGNQNEKCI